MPKGGSFFGDKSYECYNMYVFQSYNPVKGWFFKVSASDLESPDKPVVTLGTYALEIMEGGVYPLTTPYIEGRAFGDYFRKAPAGLEWHSVSYPLTGELRITKLDHQKRIVAGTFWFDAVNSAGEKVEVREGRFDMRF